MGAPVPCTPTCSIWLGGKTDVLVQGLPALMTNHSAVCPLGMGQITIKDSGQGSAEKSDPPLEFEAVYQAGGDGGSSGSGGGDFGSFGNSNSVSSGNVVEAGAGGGGADLWAKKNMATKS